jgi:RNA polymerase sigma-70 factor (ECF subfamily)
VSATDALWAIGRAAWPELDAPRAAFDACVERAGGGELRADDLYLACACATGDEAAIAALEGAHEASLQAVVARFARSGDELRQLIRLRLFEAEPGAAPRIAAYGGRGRLETWLRVAALRVCLAAIRDEEPAPPALADRFDDAELAVIEVRYRSAFRAAFAAAVARLSQAKRLVLELGLAHRLTVDQLGIVLGIDRATAAQRLATARQGLRAATMAELRASLALDETAFGTLERQVDTVVDASPARRPR